MDGVVLVVWALVSVNGMVVGAVFWVAILDRVVGGRRRLWITSLWAFVAVCVHWDLAAVAVCRGRMVFVCVCCSKVTWPLLIV